MIRTGNGTGWGGGSGSDMEERMVMKPVFMVGSVIRRLAYMYWPVVNEMGNANNSRW